MNTNLLSYLAENEASSRHPTFFFFFFHEFGKWNTWSGQHILENNHYLRGQENNYTEWDWNRKEKMEKRQEIKEREETRKEKKKNKTK